jgi:hypothetical protein
MKGGDMLSEAATPAFKEPAVRLLSLSFEHICRINCGNTRSRQVACERRGYGQDERHNGEAQRVEQYDEVVDFDYVLLSGQVSRCRRFASEGMAEIHLTAPEAAKPMRNNT